jgi:hypothetical protein
MFKILATDELVSKSGNDGIPVFYGKIVIGDFQETFAASLASWAREDYNPHWRKALEKLISGTVYVQNHVLFFGQLTQPLSPERPWDSVRDRQLIDEEGQKISEWTTTVDEIKYFLNQR